MSIYSLNITPFFYSITQLPSVYRVGGRRFLCGLSTAAASISPRGLGCWTTGGRVGGKGARSWGALLGGMGTELSFIQHISSSSCSTTHEASLMSSRWRLTILLSDKRSSVPPLPVRLITLWSSGPKSGSDFLRSMFLTYTNWFGWMWDNVRWLEALMMDPLSCR